MKGTSYRMFDFGFCYFFDENGYLGKSSVDVQQWILLALGSCGLHLRVVHNSPHIFSVTVLLFYSSIAANIGKFQRLQEPRNRSLCVWDSNLDYHSSSFHHCFAFCCLLLSIFPFSIQSPGFIQTMLHSCFC